jgi:mono/diheme cytochrome c family protein
LVGGPRLDSQQPGLAGQTLFQTKCAACHSLGSDRLVGPGLQGVTTRRDRAWLLRWIVAPDRLVAAGDPVASQLLKDYNGLPMPNLALTEVEAAAVLAFIEGPTAGAAATPPPPPAGDLVAGKGLFTGTRRLQNGGPPCMACHSIAGIGALGGGALGPDLTPAFAKYGDAGLASVLATMPFPTMRPIFGTRPLTPPEQADVRAFLGQAVAARPSRAIGQLTVLALAGAILLLVPAQLIWRRRLIGVRGPLVRGQSGASEQERD